MLRRFNVLSYITLLCKIAAHPPHAPAPVQADKKALDCLFLGVKGFFIRLPTPRKGVIKIPMEGSGYCWGGAHLLSVGQGRKPQACGATHCLYWGSCHCPGPKPGCGGMEVKKGGQRTQTGKPALFDASLWLVAVKSIGGTRLQPAKRRTGD